MKCQDCGTEEGVYETECPYASEIYGDVVLVNICDDCYHERCMAI